MPLIELWRLLTYLSFRSVKDVAEDEGAEVFVCQPDTWRNASDRFPGLSLE